jgi:Peptidase family M23/Transglycosylase SLT domain
LETLTKSSALIRHTVVYWLARRRVGKKNQWLWLLALPLLFILVLPVLFVAGILLFQMPSATPGKVDETSWEKTGTFPAVAQKYLPLYQEAGKKYGVPWPILAAIHKVETDFGRNLSVSPVGARGQTQFMPKTWVGWSYPGGTTLGDLPDSVDITNPALIKKYGGYGVDADGDGKADPNDPADAIFSTAHFLAANHRPGEDWFAPGGAVWQYNHDYEHYVLKVKQYAELFARPVLPASGPSVATGQFLWPVPGGRLTSEFGLRFHPVKKVWQEHEGIDIAREEGAPILASDGGVVVDSRPSEGYGWILVIDHGNGFRTLYAHMYEKDVLVKVGERVNKGQIIARVGSNGWVTGPHLHFEVRYNGQLVDPERVLVHNPGTQTVSSQ